MDCVFLVPVEEIYDHEAMRVVRRLGHRRRDEISPDVEGTTAPSPQHFTHPTKGEQSLLQLVFSRRFRVRLIEGQPWTLCSSSMSNATGTSSP